MGDYPQAIVPVNHVEPVPRRIRAVLGGRVVIDTVGARYVWEWSHYPQYYVPLADVDEDVLVDEHDRRDTGQGPAAVHGVRRGDQVEPHAVLAFAGGALEGLEGMARFEWTALDQWFEEDEQVFVHPRNPYTRVDALRSTRSIEITLDGITLAASSSPVMVFETGLPTRYYLDRSDVRFDRLVPSDTVTACPYKGVTSGYWSIVVDGRLRPDVAWTYDYPTRQLLPITGLVAFYNEKVDVDLDGRRLDRSRTAASR